MLFTFPMLWGFYKISHVKYLAGNPAHSTRVDPDLKKSTLCWNPSEKNNPERCFLDLPGKQRPDTFRVNFRLKNGPLWNLWNWKSTTPEKQSWLSFQVSPGKPPYKPIVYRRHTTKWWGSLAKGHLKEKREIQLASKNSCVNSQKRQVKVAFGTFSSRASFPQAAPKAQTPEPPQAHLTSGGASSPNNPLSTSQPLGRKQSNSQPCMNDVAVPGSAKDTY